MVPVILTKKGRDYAEEIVCIHQVIKNFLMNVYLAIDMQGKLVRVSVEGSLKRRFFDMGFVQGVPIKVKGKASFGDPIKIDVKGYNLSLRKKEADKIYVEV